MCYVGQTWDISTRWYPCKYANCARFKNALKYYGWDGFDHQIVVQQEMTQEEMDGYEKLWIAVLNTTDPACGYNLKSGGNSHGRHSEESKAKIRAGHLGRKMSPEAKAKLSAAKTGRKLSERHLEAMRGRVQSPETRLKISLSKIGRKMTAPRSDKGIKRGPRSEECKAKISQAQKALYAAGLRMTPDKYRKRRLENAEEGELRNWKGPSG